LASYLHHEVVGVERYCHDLAAPSSVSTFKVGNKWTKGSVKCPHHPKSATTQFPFAQARHQYRVCILKVFAISLPASLERRASVTKKLNDRNIEFEFIDAVDGRVDQHPYLKNYDEKSFLINRRRRAAPGELG
jgi:hypothetical protein